MTAKSILQKYLETWKLLKKEEDRIFKWLRDKNDYLAQKKAKIIWFAGKTFCKCVSCDKMMQRHEANGCHFIDKWRTGNYWCRWKEWCIFPWCTDCNNYNKERHKANYTIFMVKKYWLEQVEKRLHQEKQINKKPHWTELLETYKELKKRYSGNWYAP